MIGPASAPTEISESSFVKVSCPKCGSDQGAVIVSGQDHLHGIPGRYFVSECAGCGFWFQNPRLPEALHPLLYPANYVPHAEVSADRPSPGRGLKQFVKGLIRSTLTTRRRENCIDLVPDFVPQGRLLEIGCASGGRLLSLKAAGWALLHGIEMVSEAADRAARSGIEVETGRVEDVLPRFPDRYFDVIITSMVMEHLCDPFAVVKDIARKLKPRGQFLFSTIVRDSLDCKLYRKYWAGFDFPRHMVHFRLRDIQDALAKDFVDLEWSFQNAPIDFVRSSSWRNKTMDHPLIILFDSKAGFLVGQILALAGMTSRVSFRCRTR